MGTGERATVRLAKAHFPVTALGWGTRAGIWLQGCSIGCRGCISRDTWEADDSSSVEIETIGRWLDGVMTRSDGLTVSGGEPFEQPAAVAELARRARRAAAGRTIDVLAYTGRPWDEVEAAHRDVIAELDAVISEPFDVTRPADDGWRGSTNQQFHALSDLGRARAPHTWTQPRSIQVAVDGGTVWLIGIPRHGDLSRMEADLARDGIHLDDVSWRP